MNEENQKLTIKIFGSCLIMTLAGTLTLALLNNHSDIILLFMSIITTIIGILATFLQGKNMTEKQEEILTQTIQQGETDATSGTGNTGNE